MKKFKVPNTFVLIFSFIVLMAVLTWIMSGGEYKRHVKDGRTIIIPESFQKIDNQPQGLGSVLKAPLRGFVEAANIIAFVFIVGGAFGIIQATGAIDAFIATSLPGKLTIRTRSCFPSRAYIELTSPPNFLIKSTALSVLSAFIPFIDSEEYFPNIKKVAITISPFLID